MHECLQPEIIEKHKIVCARARVVLSLWWWGKRDTRVAHERAYIFTSNEGERERAGKLKKITHR